MRIFVKVAKYAISVFILFTLLYSTIYYLSLYFIFKDNNYKSKLTEDDQDMIVTLSKTKEKTTFEYM